MLMFVLFGDTFLEFLRKVFGEEEHSAAKVATNEWMQNVVNSKYAWRVGFIISLVQFALLHLTYCGNACSAEQIDWISFEVWLAFIGPVRRFDFARETEEKGSIALCIFCCLLEIFCAKRC